MNDVARAFAVSIVFLSVAAMFVLRGPLGRALAERIAGRHQDQLAEDETLRLDLDHTKHRLAEVEERLDFAERLLTKQRDAERVAPPR